MAFVILVRFFSFGLFPSIMANIIFIVCFSFSFLFIMGFRIFGFVDHFSLLFLCTLLGHCRCLFQLVDRTMDQGFFYFGCCRWLHTREGASSQPGRQLLVSIADLFGRFHA